MAAIETALENPNGYEKELIERIRKDGRRIFSVLGGEARAFSYRTDSGLIDSNGRSARQRSPKRLRATLL